jgi:hypothetical protein
MDRLITRSLAVLAVLGVVACTTTTPTQPVPTRTTALQEPTLTLPPPDVVSQPTPAPTQAPPTVAAPTDVPLFGPETYPVDVNPLTGEQVDPAVLARIPIAVKITNFPLSARPQSGLSRADLVFEHIAEAGLTRFTAFFLQNDVDPIGSIRSARFIDAEIVPNFQAVLVTSGSSLGTMAKLRNTAWFLGADGWRLVSEESAYSCPPLCRARPDDTNSLFASTTAVRAALIEQASAAGQPPPGRADLRGLAFSPRVASGAPAVELAIRFSGSAQVSWRYDATIGRYARWQETAPDGPLTEHLDANTSTQLTAANVVVISANHQNNFVPEDFRDGGYCGYEIQLWTSGPARLLRDGVVIEGRWVRDVSTGMRLQFFDAANAPLLLKPGNTWFEVVPLTAPVELADGLMRVSGRVPDTQSVCPVPPTPTPDPLAITSTP